MLPTPRERVPNRGNKGPGHVTDRGGVMEMTTTVRRPKNLEAKVLDNYWLDVTQGGGRTWGTEGN